MKKRISISISSDEVVQELKTLAHKHQMSMSAYVRHACIGYDKLYEQLLNSD